MIEEQKLKYFEEKVSQYYGKEQTKDEFISFVDKYLIMPRKLGIPRGTNSRHIKKHLRGEAYPIQLFLLSLRKPIKSITLEGGNKNYDAVLRVDDEKSFFIEVTCPKDGRLENQQSHHIEKYGSVLSSDLPECVDDSLEEEKERILTIISKKTNKKYNPNTILIVTAGGFPLCEDANWERLCSELRPCVQGNKTFTEIHLVNFNEPERTTERKVIKLSG